MADQIPEDVRRLITQGNAKYNDWASRMGAQPAGTVTTRSPQVSSQGYSSGCELYSWKDPDTGRTMWNTNNPRYNTPRVRMPQQQSFRQQAQSRDRLYRVADSYRDSYRAGESNVFGVGSRRRRGPTLDDPFF